MLIAFFSGLTVGFSLIVAIGAQNAFVLRQGLLGKHVFSVALFCSVSDGLLIFVGISGAIKVLQETANGKGADIDVDGKIGPNTIKAIQNLSVQRVRAFRALKFAKIVIANPKQMKFWYGWFRRSLKV